MNATSIALRQHRRIEQRIRALFTEGHHRSRCIAALFDDLTAHLVIESSLLYPAAQNALGISLQASRALHRRAKELVMELASAPPAGEAFLQKARELESIFAQHVVLDEREILPALAGALDAHALEELGEDMERMACALEARRVEPASARGMRVGSRAA